MRRRPGVFAPQSGINVSDLIRKTAADMERVGQENRRRLDDRGHDYSGTPEVYILARIRGDGSWYGETIESVSAKVGRGDIGNRDRVSFGQITASGPTEQGMLVDMRMQYARRLVERKVCQWDEARQRTAEVSFRIAETLGRS